MRLLRLIKLFCLIVSCLALAFMSGCKEEDENYPSVPDAVYLVSNSVTGPGSTALTTISNSGSGKVTVSPAVAKVYVNTVKDFDVTIRYALSGTAVAGVNYTPPAETAVTIPAGQWYASIRIPVINTPVLVDKTIVITLISASNDVQLGLGTDRTYKTFTYTLQK
ncbi:hypothetical protein [Pararcticibacter amylolyticus]|nr:hypothetical protein [Pararcticibacter amylolyticus]